MPRSYLDAPRPIAALATPGGRSALAVIRTSGPGTFELLASCFSRPSALLEAPGLSLVHGFFMDGRTGERIDEVLVALFRAPKSPTGEDQAEVSCHGSPVIVRRILSCLHVAGFAPALPGEFSFRAFTQGKSDLVEAEAVAELVDARSEGARGEALRRLEGRLSRRLGEARKALLDLLAEAEVRLDYAEEDGSPSELFPRGKLAALRAELATLAASWRTGRLYAEGAMLALAGRTNAGKSSLFNLLLREDRALVSPEPGTTRDWIEAGVEIGGFPLRLVDTAGLRAGPEGIEARGIERSRALVSEADLVCCLVDSSLGPGAEDEELLALRPDALRIWTKTDLPDSLPCPRGWIPLSTEEGRGLEALHEALATALKGLAGRPPEGGPPDRDEVAIANLRQKELLERAVEALDAVLGVLDASSPAGVGELLDAAALELRVAAEALGELTGEIVSAEVLETIFAGFCLGK